MAASTLLDFGRDVQGYNAFSPIPSKNMYNATLAAATARTVTTPSNYQSWVVAFSYEPATKVWVDFTGATAAVPVSSSFAATTSELNPASRKVVAGQTISVITANTTADIGVSFYAIPQS